MPKSVCLVNPGRGSLRWNSKSFKFVSSGNSRGQDATMRKEIWGQVIVGVIVAILGAIGGWVWSNATHVIDYSLLRKGMVIPFAAAKCPEPWKAYAPAYGRFVRGIDPEGKTDPDGTRPFGSQQPDGLAAHTHQVGLNGGDSTSMVPGGATRRLANFVDDAFGGGSPKQTSPNIGGLSETRPKNVALLYCILE